MFQYTLLPINSFITSSDQSIPSLDDILDDESLKRHKQFVEQVEKQVRHLTNDSP